jgi:hypothetical protein
MIVEHPRQIIQRLVAALVECPVTDSLPDRLESFGCPDGMSDCHAPMETQASQPHRQSCGDRGAQAKIDDLYPE